MIILIKPTIGMCWICITIMLFVWYVDISMVCKFLKSWWVFRYCWNWFYKYCMFLVVTGPGPSSTSLIDKDLAWGPKAQSKPAVLVVAVFGLILARVLLDGRSSNSFYVEETVQFSGADQPLMMNYFYIFYVQRVICTFKQKSLKVGQFCNHLSK